MRQHTVRGLWIALALMLLIATSGRVHGHLARPSPRQVYQFIRMNSDSRAGDIRWIETWETIDEESDTHEIVMVDGHNTPEGNIDTTCYYARTVGSSTPVYMVNFQLQPVADPDSLWAAFANRNLLDQSLRFATLPGCTSMDQTTVNGFTATRCIFSDRGATELFLVRPPATASGDLWQSVPDAYPVRYTFTADGSDTDVLHRYELQLTPPEYSPIPDTSGSFLCFDGSFPLPERVTEIQVRTFTYLAFKVDDSLEDAVSAMERTLIPVWQPSGSQTYRDGMAYSYTRELSSGVLCHLTMRYTDSTQVAAEVFPDYANIENVPLPEGLTGPIVIQSHDMTVENSVEEVVADYLARLPAEGWDLRKDLTDIRADSALITFARDNFVTYIVVDQAPSTRSSLRVQVRPAVCGPTFAHP